MKRVLSFIAVIVTVFLSGCNNQEAIKNQTNSITNDTEISAFEESNLAELNTEESTENVLVDSENYTYDPNITNSMVYVDGDTLYLAKKDGIYRRTSESKEDELIYSEQLDSSRAFAVYRNYLYFNSMVEPKKTEYGFLPDCLRKLDLNTLESEVLLTGTDRLLYKNFVIDDVFCMYNDENGEKIAFQLSEDGTFGSELSKEDADTFVVSYEERYSITGELAPGSEREYVLYKVDRVTGEKETLVAAWSNYWTMINDGIVYRPAKEDVDTYYFYSFETKENIRCVDWAEYPSVEYEGYDNDYLYFSTTEGTDKYFIYRIAKKGGAQEKIATMEGIGRTPYINVLNHVIYYKKDGKLLEIK